MDTIRMLTVIKILIPVALQCPLGHARWWYALYNVNASRIVNLNMNSAYCAGHWVT